MLAYQGKTKTRIGVPISRIVQVTGYAVLLKIEPQPQEDVIQFTTFALSTVQETGIAETFLSQPGKTQLVGKSDGAFKISPSRR
ncbi:MAG: hypothetical protein CBE00_14010 [Planctomycetaceae bacterium TMED240]|nr:hypothetical protein [Rhodopirellula sp.]OUX03663.1 MAG: hypothetical protein CBE00_14010 [Planctomycetaceae bacterium TMED240]